MNIERARKIMATLKNLASKNEHLGLNDLRMVVALERAVARIETDPKLAKHLIFKGGFVLLKTANSTRFTRDIDALAKGMEQNQVIDSIRKALSLDLDDGLWFGDIKTRDLGRDLPYPGIRFDAAFQIGEPPAQDGFYFKLLIYLRVMVGVTNLVEPLTVVQEHPVLWKRDRRKSILT